MNPAMAKASVSTMIAMFFIMYSADTFSILPITDLPSLTMVGRVLKLLSVSIMRDILRATSFAEPKEMEQSLSRSAFTSFTPSPIIPTVLPFLCRQRTISRFWSGDTLPKTTPSSAFSSSSSLESPRQFTHLSALNTPVLAAMLDTVSGLSPEIIFTSTSFL